MHPEIQRMREIVLVYLDRSGGLQKFMHDCKKYNDSKQSYAVYRFIVSINPSDIAELDATLGNYILHNPIQAAQIFQSVCFIAIKTLSLIEQLQTIAQISILLKPTHLPPLPSYMLSLSTFPFNYTSQRFYESEGIVIAMGTVTKYTQGARFLCTEETCPFSEGFRYIRVHLPGATESATVRNDFVCSLCSSPLQEDMKFRVLGDKQVVEMIDVKALNALKGYSNSKAHFRIQTFTVFLRDELANRMTIGNHYKIIGIPACVQNGSQATVCIEVSSVQLCKPKGPTCISDNFKYLLSLTSSSCWRFTAVLANIFASQVVPPGTYNTLKLTILLSLVVTCEKANEIADYLDLLIVTSDTLIIDRLLNYSICLLPRGIRHPSASEIFPTVSKDKHGTGSASIQACSALLAKGGICYIGDLSSYKKDKLEFLQSVLESRTTTIFIPGKKYGEEADQQVTIPVQTNFWSYVDLDASSKKHVQKDSSLIGQMDLSLISPNLLDVFGLLIYNEFPSCRLSFPLVHHILKKAINPEAMLYRVSQQFRTQDYEEFILFAKNLHVELSSEAENLIQGYYLASRRVRRDAIHGSKLSASALKMLISLSKAHTKLSLRTKVLEEDALIAILLLESSLTLKHGKSALCVAPNAVFPFDLSDENSLQQRDIYLMQCHHQLLKFIRAYSPGIHVTTNEE
ncbi:MCM domain-containing protein 2 [Struthio camelus australis]|uniref:Minichromosome maintenance domain-containing protein 2 n=1 Tax=Struthio camelus australis TaxID=441894 RepID=A0A093H5Z8_STRCA|nr:PREDICTED: MCM domain-containing protein 2 [Struthio camelus australis]KFV78013.1 MCM domain-containing protein 2 [Struthio camelus australis]